MTGQDERLKPLETLYDGHRFRSRREARWAVFFKEAGIPAEYEEQGYDLGAAGWYLPDFRVNKGTHADHFFEVKGVAPTRRARHGNCPCPAFIRNGLANTSQLRTLL